jgi:hypothetical protein
MDLKLLDPKGLIRESYVIEGIDDAQCRSIFLDWALGVPLGEDMKPRLELLLDHYAADAPDHPMTHVLKAGLAEKPAPKRRGGRRARVKGS